MKTTAEIQEMLDTNEQLIKAIMETQAQGAFSHRLVSHHVRTCTLIDSSRYVYTCTRTGRQADAAQYLQRLQQNLMILAAAADSQVRFFPLKFLQIYCQL